MCAVTEHARFTLLQVQFPQHHLLKRLSFLHCIFSPPLLWIHDRRFTSVFRGFCPAPLVCISVFVALLCCFDDSALVVYSEVWECDSSRTLFCLILLFSLKIALTIWGLLCFPTNRKFFDSSSVKNAVNDLIRVALHL